MIAVPTAWWAHYPFDFAAWGSAALAARWQYRRWPEQARALAAVTTPSYHVSLALGALAGALAGGILAVELWKWRHGLRQSTGNAFALPLAAGIAVGRLGCFFSGIADYTYGAPSTLPWAVDIGDGIARHPVQLYEAAAMALFACLLARARMRGARWAEAHAFHALVIVYAAQRFWWEFLKPYPPLAGPLNVFHLLMLGMGAYGLVWWRRGDGEPAAGR